MEDNTEKVSPAAKASTSQMPDEEDTKIPVVEASGSGGSSWWGSWIDTAKSKVRFSLFLFIEKGSK